jgi:TolB-like protein/DNA-binding winged helix-turn-helix (wHTH) protein/tetratricopeptide (TPR) repeat protein
VSNIVRFDCYEVDLPAGQLYKHGIRISLREKSFQVLVTLLEHPGEVVSREDLRRRLWQEEVFVDFDNNLNTAVARLREALNDSADHPHYIETLPKRGYRFMASVAEPPAAEAELLPSAPEWPASNREVPPPWRPRRFLLLGASSVVALLLVIGLNFKGIRDWWWRQSSGLATPIRIESLAVLPFENLSGDASKDYFADGFTDELITDLAEEARIRVVSRSSVMRYKGSKKPLPEIARELRVDAIVEGSVSLSDQHVRLTAQLIHAADDRHLWAHSYERERKDLFHIQGEVAATIAGLIREKTKKTDFVGLPIAYAHPRFTPETYELFLECQELHEADTQESENHAIRCYQRLLALDPKCAAAYAGLAFSYGHLNLESVPKARAAAVKAIELDPSLPEAHAALAEFMSSYEKDFAGAEAELKQALALNPSYAKAHGDYSLLLMVSGRVAEAIAEARTSQDLDPLSARRAMFSGMIFFMARQYDATLEAENTALKLDPHLERARYWLGYAYEQKGMYRKAIAEYEKNLPTDGNAISLMAMGRSLYLAGDLRKADEVRYRIEHFPTTDTNYVWPYDAALFYAALGDKDRAFQWLEKDQNAHDGWLMFLRVDPRLASLRDDPRLAELAGRVGLPAPH